MTIRELDHMTDENTLELVWDDDLNATLHARWGCGGTGSGSNPRCGSRRRHDAMAQSSPEIAAAPAG